MPTTPTYGLRYPSLADAPNGPDAVQDLAEDVEATLGSIAPVSAVTINAKGDLLAGTANDTVSRLAVGADGAVGVPGVALRAAQVAVALQPREFKLLEYLMRHAGIPVTREQISEQVWKQPFDPTTNIVDVYINYLRKKLESEGATPLVHTVRGVGYVLREADGG